jgi:hypothetical protein
VEEVSVPDGYTSSISGSAAAGFVITNTMEHGKLIIEKRFDIQQPEPEEETEEVLIDIPVTKIWDDNDNKDGNRPDHVTVHLFAGGTEVASAVLNEGNGWATTFTELPANADGNAIRYSVTEDPVPMYVPEIRGFRITNVYQPELTSASVRKVWNDENNKFGIRPTSIHATLHNGSTVVKVVLLNEANNWSATVEELPAIINGQPVTYTWTEQEMIGYTLEKTEHEGNMTTFTNKMYEKALVPDDQKPPKGPGNTVYVFEEYDTPLGVEVVINHVGDCFD